MQAINTIKAGEYFKRTETAAKVYIKGAYDKASKTFSCHPADDMNAEIFIKASKPVFVGFTY